MFFVILHTFLTAKCKFDDLKKNKIQTEEKIMFNMDYKIITVMPTRNRFKLFKKV